jgi:glycerol-3-phosphate acyltransferase PlsY
MFLLIALFSYLMGSISFAVLASHWAQLPDPRTQGSGNPGASNVFRLGHRKLAIFVLIGDSLKSIIPLTFAKAQGFSEAYLAWLLVAACVGHIFPIFFNLRGGKGIATALGGLLVLSWPTACVAIGTWLGVFLLCRYAALASLAAIMSSLAIVIWFGSPAIQTPITLLSGLLIARHSSNWTRLWKGTEPRVDSSDHPL